jgi:hypothetical protein
VGQAIGRGREGADGTGVGARGGKEATAANTTAASYRECRQLVADSPHAAVDFSRAAQVAWPVRGAGWPGVAAAVAGEMSPRGGGNCRNRRDLWRVMAAGDGLTHVFFRLYSPAVFASLTDQVACCQPSHRRAPGHRRQVGRGARVSCAGKCGGSYSPSWRRAPRRGMRHSRFLQHRPLVRQQ